MGADRGSLRGRTDQTVQADQPVLVDLADRCGQVGHLERRDQVLLDVQRVCPVHGHRARAAPEHRVAEGKHLVAAHGRCRAGTSLGEVTVGDRSGQVATSDHGRRCRRAGSASPEHPDVLEVDELLDLAQRALCGETGDAERQRQPRETTGCLGAGEVTTGNELAGRDTGDLDRASVDGLARGLACGCCERLRIEQGLHVRGRRDTRDRAGAEREPVRHGADESAVGRVDR